MIHFLVERVFGHSEFIEAIGARVKHKRNRTMQAAGTGIVKVFLEAGLVAGRIRVRLAVLQVRKDGRGKRLSMRSFELQLHSQTVIPDLLLYLVP